MPEVIRAHSPSSIQTSLLGKETLAPQMVEAAVVRLCWLCIICAFLITVSLLVQSLLQPEMASLIHTPAAAVWISILLISLGMTVIRRFQVLSPLAILRLGLLFEVLVASGISFSETALPLSPSHPVLGASKVALWIAVVGLMIPNRPLTKFAVALASASTWPAAYFLNLHLYGYDPLPLNRLVVWIYIPYIMAFVTYAVSKRIYVMESAVQKASELGSYNLVSLIGSGGMGEVWRARHRMLARDAAIKLIRSDLLMGKPGNQSEIARKRFAREAQAIASLQSPHTVYLYDFGVSREGFFYYVMELLDGISLEMLVQKFGPQPASRVVHILRQVCESLEEAHRQELIHRDVKPSNIFICNVGIQYDFSKVLDFGLVKDISPAENATLTMEGISAGTPAYMAPEIAMGEGSIDGRVDLYGLGCVAYFLLTGSPVFEEKTATAIALAHVQKTPVPPSQRSEMKIPPLLEQAILLSLAKNPGDRPQSAADFSRLLASSGTPEWTQEQASDWWQAYLPVSSEHRTARQPRIADPVSVSTP